MSHFTNADQFLLAVRTLCFTGLAFVVSWAPLERTFAAETSQRFDIEGAMLATNADEIVAALTAAGFTDTTCVLDLAAMVIDGLGKLGGSVTRVPAVEFYREFPYDSCVYVHYNTLHTPVAKGDSYQIVLRTRPLTDEEAVELLGALIERFGEPKWFEEEIYGAWLVLGDEFGELLTWNRHRANGEVRVSLDALGLGSKDLENYLKVMGNP